MINFKKLNNLINKYDGFISLQVGIGILIIGLFYFLMGFHNFDIGQNLKYMGLLINNYQLENNLTQEHLFVETNMRGEVFEFDEFSGIYREGVAKVFDGLFYIIIGMFLIGYGIRDYLGLIKGDKNG